MEIEILLYNYWEHVKIEKDLSKVLPPEHPKRVELIKSINIMAQKITEFKIVKNEKNKRQPRLV